MSVLLLFHAESAIGELGVFCDAFNARGGVWLRMANW